MKFLRLMGIILIMLIMAGIPATATTIAGTDIVRHADGIENVNSNMIVAYMLYDKEDPMSMDTVYFIDITTDSVITEGYNITHYASEELYAYSADYDLISGFINDNGSILHEPNLLYGGHLEYHEGISRYVLDGLEGYIDAQGNMLVEPMYDITRDFNEGYAAVNKDDKWGYIDTQGNVVIDLQYDSANTFSSGIALVSLGEEWFFIDTEGTRIFDFHDIDGVSNRFVGFYNGFARTNLDGKHGYYDITGKMSIEPQFDNAYEFSNGYAAVRVNEKWGMINTEGNIVVEPIYDEIYSSNDPLIKCQYAVINNGCAIVLSDDKWGVIDTNGNIIAEPQYDKCTPFGEVILTIKDGKYGIVYSNGTIVEPKFDKIGKYSDGYASICVDGLFGFINEQGVVVVEPSYEQISSAYNDGLAAVRINTEWFVIDMEGNIVY